MHSTEAENKPRALIGARIGGWLVERFKGAGKSATVFEAVKNGQRAALKVFNSDLVERFGKAIQLGRIDRERALVGEQHANLVRILDGGECPFSGSLFVAMELVDAPNLGSVLRDVPRDSIVPLIQQIASAARFLEARELAHRDIKPENIAVLPDFSKAVLLDLGVLRPIGDPALTDGETRGFVGTLRYGSPEFIVRAEDDTPEGWRAVTFYQLGGVLHDLIMRRPLFEEFSDPYPLLVTAIMNESPLVRADDVPADVVLLAQNCLVKSPKARLRLVSWDDFDALTKARPHSEGARERVRKRSLMSRTQQGHVPAPPRQSAEQVTQRTAERIEQIVRAECVGSDAFPRMTISQSASGPTHVRTVFSKSMRHSLPHDLSIRFDCDVVDEEVTTVIISVSACLVSSPDAPHGTPPSPETVFRGPFESDNLAVRVQDFLWSAMDSAQRKGALCGSDGMPCWLSSMDHLEEPK